MKAGACHNWGSHRPGHPTPWQVAPGRKYNGISGSELVRYALIICHGCPAQYDCATYAVKATMIAGTWSMPVTQLRWLQAQDDGLDLIEIARSRHAAVQTVIAEAFTGTPAPA